MRCRGRARSKRRTKRIGRIAFSPFLPHFSLPSLLGLSPPSPFQIYGVYIAFHTYHSLRKCEHVSWNLILDTCNARVKGCKIARHLIAASIGRVRLRHVSPSPSSFSPSASGSTRHTRTDPAGDPGPSALSLPPDRNANDSDSSDDAVVTYPLNLRLRQT